MTLVVYYVLSSYLCGCLSKTRLETVGTKLTFFDGLVVDLAVFEPFPF